MRSLYVAALLLVAFTSSCREAQDRVRRVPSPKGEYHFRVYCKTFDRCLSDAREICPHGFSKEEVGPSELVFWCHGKADW